MQDPKEIDHKRFDFLLYITMSNIILNFAVLQGLESHHVNLLTKEWEKREKERENLVHEKLSEIFSVEKELKQVKSK